jgi:hypothetical protein
VHAHVRWDITPFGFVNSHRCVKGTYFLHLQAQAIICLTLKTKTLHPFEMLAAVYESTCPTIWKTWNVTDIYARPWNLARSVATLNSYTWQRRYYCDYCTTLHIMSTMIVLLGSEKTTWPHMARYLYIEFNKICQLTCVILFCWLRQGTGELTAVQTGTCTSLRSPVCAYWERWFDSRACFYISWRNRRYIDSLSLVNTVQFHANMCRWQNVKKYLRIPLRMY